MNDKQEQRTCPKCGQDYTKRPAVSRIDGGLICPDCGIREALESLGVDTVEQDKILETIHIHEVSTVFSNKCNN